LNVIEVLLTFVLLGIVAIICLQLVSIRRSSAPPAMPEISEIRSSVNKVQGTVELLERGGRDDSSRLRLELAGQNQAFKLEVATVLKQTGESMSQKLDSFNSDANQKIDLLRTAISDSGIQLQTQVGTELERVRSGVGQASEHIRKTMDDRLEQMRQTVDEKLQKTLETRLGESFQIVTTQLNEVHKGLGEMQFLATGVIDLKRMLTNVRARGIWGEVQLGSLLEEILRPEQYDKNVPVTGTSERVEFAIRLPGGEDGQPRWLPIDAKFPLEDYQRIMEASEKGDATAVEKACRGLDSTLRNCAKDIHEKYISEPRTTGFAILFLATEGLYSEALRRTGLVETLQREFSVMVAGPSTFAALLTSLRVGFRTLTIEQKASEVTEYLVEVRMAFARYAGLIGKVKRKLQQASTAVEIAEKGTNRLQKALGELENGSGAVLVDSGLDDDEHTLLTAAGEM
jgi:DNA recombination protein RmuC